MNSPTVYEPHLTDEETEGCRRVVTGPRSCRQRIIMSAFKDGLALEPNTELSKHLLATPRTELYMNELKKSYKIKMEDLPNC